MTLQNAAVIPFLLLSAACALAVPSADPLPPVDVAQRLIEARGNAEADTILCRLEGQVLHYAGATETPLLDCLDRHEEAEHLVITSYGGSVREAIPAAQRLAEMSLDVTVAGVCGSSCGNYVVPAAASLTVLADSAIYLHGAPSADTDEIRASLRPALRKAGVPEDRLSAFVEQQLPRLLGLRAMHDRFAADRNVADEWYDLSFYYREIEARGEGGVLVVSPDFLRACVPGLEVRRFWVAQRPQDAQRLEDLLGLGPLFVMPGDLPAPASCG